MEKKPSVEIIKRKEKKGIKEYEKAKVTEVSFEKLKEEQKQIVEEKKEKMKNEQKKARDMSEHKDMRCEKEEQDRSKNRRRLKQVDWGGGR